MMGGISDPVRCLLPVVLLLIVACDTLGAPAAGPAGPLTTRATRVCATPDSGIWMMRTDSERSGSVTALHDHALAYPDQTWRGKLPPAWRGSTPDREQAWNLTGWYADLIGHIMLGAGVTNYTVRFLPQYSSALYATTKSGLCDVSFSPFTITAARTNCLGPTAATSSNPTGVQACTDPVNASTPPSNQDACCANFGTPTQAFEPVLMVTSDFVMPSVLDSLFTFDVINISSFLLCGIILAAHFVWIVERVENPQQFPMSYLDGIDDAIWWSCTTVTTVGYGDKFPVTNLGRMFALVWMFSGVAFLGLFAGTISASVERASALRGINSMEDLDPTSKVCTPSPSYIPAFLTGSDKLFESYAPLTNSLEECIEDLLAGRATGVFYDEPVRSRSSVCLVLQRVMFCADKAARVAHPPILPIFASFFSPPTHTHTYTHYQILKYFFVAHGKRALPTPRYSEGSTIQGTFKLVRQAAKAPGAVTDYLAPVFPHVRAGTALRGRPGHIATPEDELFARSLEEHMNVALTDYISSEEATRVFSVYFPESVGNEAKDGVVGPAWAYIAPCLIFVGLYWILAGGQKFEDEEFDGWLRAGGCARCQRGRCKGTEKRRRNEDGTHNANAEEEEEEEEETAEDQNGTVGNKETASIVSGSTKDQDGSPLSTHSFDVTSSTAAAASVDQGDLELAIAPVTPEKHQAASAIQRRIRRSLVAMKLRIDQSPAHKSDLFTSREATMKSIRAAQRRHGRTGGRSGHYTTLFANGPEFEGLAEETHQMHRVMLEQARDVDTLKEMVERLVRIAAEEERYRAAATVGM